MVRWIAAISMMVFLLSGCGNNELNHSSPSQQNNGNNLQAQDDDTGNKVIEDHASVEEHLEALAKEVDGVIDAHCVIMGNTAIVGINVDGNTERSRVGMIKYSVAEAFQSDPYGIDALVTADIDISNRLKEIGSDIREGHPITGFTNEMSDIIGRLIPQLPRDIAPPMPVEEQAGDDVTNKLEGNQ